MHHMHDAAEAGCKAYLALPVGYQPGLLGRMLLIPTQGLKATAKSHEGAVDGHAFSA